LTECVVVDNPEDKKESDPMAGMGGMFLMKTEKQEFLELIATRVPPGDRWTLVNDKVVYTYSY
jgi:hypothetical protein